MKKEKTIVIIVVLVILGFGVMWKMTTEEYSVKMVSNFDECVAVGNPVMESYPRQCRHGDRTFAEVIIETFHIPERQGIGEENAGGDMGILPFKSGVEGRVLLGPMCPVMRNPPDPNCADKGYETTVQIIEKNSSKSSLFSSVETGKEGGYRAMLPPGEFSVQAIGGQPFPYCEMKKISIGPDEMVKADLSCDTGIR
ncbi:MAG: hypothetical protein NUV53_02635 [Patescibacteria group bacterium]|nr:hypothetical protein [Patescibacteria group bacterium]